jgi:hypothetical protein
MRSRSLLAIRSYAKSLLAAKSDVPTGDSFSRSRLLEILELARYRNSARIARDVTPLLVPSPELLCIDGQDDLKDLREAINAQWTQWKPPCGLRPKPYLTVGIADTAFEDDEFGKSRGSNANTCATLSAEGIYFPFLICEVKGGDLPLEGGEQQCMHAASISVRSIVELFDHGPTTEKVDGKILVFSVVHDVERVKIFGHFAVIQVDGTLQHYRRLVCAANFADDVANGQWYKTYGVICAIYKEFFPQHLAQIRSALCRLPWRCTADSLGCSRPMLKSVSHKADHGS